MILVCGEALVDLFVNPGDPSGTSLNACVGGSPFNLARGVSRLDVPTAYLGGISTDHFGSLLVEAALSEGIDMSLVKHSSRPSPLVVVSPDSSGHPSYAFYAHHTAEGDFQPADLPAQIPEAIAAIAMGSVALALEPFASALLALAKREARRRVISLDPNLRPTMVGPLDAWRTRIDALADHAAIIKLSEEDFLTGWPQAEPEELFGAWLSRGVSLVVMTRGSAGASAWCSAGRTNQPAIAVPVIDAVGAGDGFHAALLARLLQTGRLNREALARIDLDSVEDAVRYASVAAGLTCGRRGADLPRLAELEAAFRAD